MKYTITRTIEGEGAGPRPRKPIDWDRFLAPTILAGVAAFACLVVLVIAAAERLVWDRAMLGAVVLALATCSMFGVLLYLLVRDELRRREMPQQPPPDFIPPFHLYTNPAPGGPKPPAAGEVIDAEAVSPGVYRPKPGGSGKP